MTKYKIGIFMFTRDMRLDDNTTLLKALHECDKVIPIFIFNPKQITNKNEYKSNNCIQFMCECIDDLNIQLNKKNSKLFLFYGNPIKVLQSLISNNININAIYFNKDYTPFATKREYDINELCKKKQIQLCMEEDYLLTGIDKVHNVSGNSYLKFTPFMRTAKKLKVREPIKNNKSNYIPHNYKLNNKYEYIDDYHNFYKYNEHNSVIGGRNNAIKILNSLDDFKKYSTERNFPSTETTHLSAYLKFNVVSIREVYYAVKNKLNINTKLIDQLYWRDFYMIIAYNHPHIFGHNMKQNYKMKWKNNKSLFEKWKNGITGIPIIDASMRQMNTIGWMHNRPRMIVANFLIKVMQIDWRYGEKYFAQKLVDYDPCNNNGGWQWSAGTGTDSQPYFRYFNPWSQSEKYDYDCKYIKKWIPELQNVDNKDIHKWYLKYNDSKYSHIKYIKPIYNNDQISEQVKKTIQMYKNVA